MTTIEQVKMRIPGKRWTELLLGEIQFKPWELALPYDEVTPLPKGYDSLAMGKKLLTQEAELQQRVSSPEHPHPHIQIAHGIGNYGTEKEGLDHALKLQRITGKRLSQLLEPETDIEDIGESALVQLMIKTLAQVSSAVQHCHDKGIVHCNVSPYNIIVETEKKGKIPTGRNFLIDFSRAHEIGSMKTTPKGVQEPDKFFGAPEYDEGQISPFTDTYSFSKLAYLALTGKFPRQNADCHELMKHTGFLGELGELIAHGQAAYPLARPPFEEICRVLNEYAALVKRAEKLTE